MSYDLRATAEAGVPSRSSFYVALQMQRTDAAGGAAVYAATVDAPLEWRERDVFLHVEGAGAPFAVFVEGQMAGFVADTKTPAEIRISPLMTDGKNRIQIEVGAVEDGASLETPRDRSQTPAVGKVFVYSQPRTRIEDYMVSAKPWGGGSKSGRLELEIALSNGYNFPETVSVGYDIYSPAGKLLYYDKREVELPGTGRDTVRFVPEIYGGATTLWTPAKPNLYRVMLIVWREGRIIEYVPLKAGFSDRGFGENLAIIRKASDAGKIARYGVAPGAAEAKVNADLKALKAKGVTVLRTECPQPVWFYDLCDAVGLYVIDQTGIAGRADRLDRRVGGTPVNDPRFLEACLERQRYMWARTRNHPCIVGWSMGTQAGNGYNMYKCYQLLKSLDGIHPVVYDDAAGEWNTDL